MKKTITAMFLFLTLMAFSAQKSGIAKYDNLQYSDGKTIIFFGENGNVLKDIKNAEFERKVYYQGDKLYIVVDYFTDTKEPAFIFETKEEHIKEYEPSDENTLNGVVIYYGNGNMSAKGIFQGNAKNGTVTLYDENGIETDTVIFKDGIVQ